MQSKINEWFDHVYLINLDRSTDRLAQATRNCAAVGITFERFSATDGNVADVPFVGPETAGWNKRAAALCETTIRLLREAKEKKYTSVFIMEDDVSFSPMFLLRLSEMRLPKDYEFFHLRISTPLNSKWVRSGVMQFEGAWCCQAYAVHESVYDLMIENLLRFDRPLDQVTFELQKRGKAYAPITNLVEHPTNYSTLRERVIDYTREG